MRHRITYLLVPLLTSSLAAQSLDLQTVVAKAHQELGAEGLSVAVIDPLGELSVAVAGEREVGVSVTAETAFEIASVSKVMTAALALRFERDGFLSLDDPLEKFFPELPNASRIKLRQLLNHTSGLKDPLQDQRFLMQYYFSPSTAPDARGVLDAVTGFDFEPGESWAYSNAGFIATALILEKVQERTFPDIFQQHLVAPLGLSAVGVETWDPEAGPLAHGFRDLAGNGTYVDMSAFTDSGPFLSASTGAGSVIATSSALAVLLRAILTGGLLNEVERATMRSWVDRPDGHRYGLGLLRIEDSRGRILEGHRGNSAGFSAEAWHLPEHSWTVVVLSNRGGILVSPVTERVLDHLIDESAPD